MGPAAAKKPHAVCIPYSGQGHITPMLDLAKILHSRGFHITFVNTEYIHNRLLQSMGPSSLDGLPDFRFAAIPDGLPEPDTKQDVEFRVPSTLPELLPAFRDLLAELADPSSGSPPVSCIVADGLMTWTLDAAEALGLPEVLLWTTSACGLMAYLHCKELSKRDLVPLPDLEMEIEGIPGMEGMKAKDLPSFLRAMEPRDVEMTEFLIAQTSSAARASAIVLNTFEDLEGHVLEAMSLILPPVYSVGPLALASQQIPAVGSMGSNLWKKDPGCLQWLEGKPEASVVYVNFGSIILLSREQLLEFAWGLAGCGHEFLWVVRPGLLLGENEGALEEFVEKTRGRGLLASWCPQEEVLRHPAVGGFLMHCGWNSIVESVCAGVPLACWPLYAEQHTNRRYCCTEWGIGVEVRRGEVESVIRELMGGDGGRRMRAQALKWKEKAVEATVRGGSSSRNLDALVGLLMG